MRRRFLGGARASLGDSSFAPGVSSPSSTATLAGTSVSIFIGETAAAMMRGHKEACPRTSRGLKNNCGQLCAEVWQRICRTPFSVEFAASGASKSGRWRWLRFGCCYVIKEQKRSSVAWHSRLSCQPPPRKPQFCSTWAGISGTECRPPSGLGDFINDFRRDMNAPAQGQWWLRASGSGQDEIEPRECSSHSGEWFDRVTRVSSLIELLE
jgi:hypothetical protein